MHAGRWELVAAEVKAVMRADYSCLLMHAGLAWELGEAAVQATAGAGAPDRFQPAAQRQLQWGYEAQAERGVCAAGGPPHSLPG